MSKMYSQDDEKVIFMRKLKLNSNEKIMNTKKKN